MKNETKKGLIRFAIIAIGMLIFFVFQVKSGFKATEKDSEYYQKTNLKFSGIVKKVKPLTSYGHGYGVIHINLSNSNKELYDPRDTLDRFLGVVKNEKADLVFNRISEIQIGDSIDFNIQDFMIYRNGKLIRKSIVGMPPDDIFKPFNEVNANIEL